MFEVLRYVSTSISPLINTNFASRFLPHVRFSDLLIFTSSRAGVLPLDAVQFGKMRLPSVQPRSASQVTGCCINSPFFCFVTFILKNSNVPLFVINVK